MIEPQLWNLVFVALTTGFSVMVVFVVGIFLGLRKDVLFLLGFVVLLGALASHFYRAGPKYRLDQRTDTIRREAPELRTFRPHVMTDKERHDRQRELDAETDTRTLEKE